MNTTERYEKIGDIGLTLLLNVSARGGGLYLYLPKDLVEVQGILAGDRIEVKLGKIHRHKKYIEEAEKE